MVTYDEIFLRNRGYVSLQLQQKIRSTRILIAGCGIGSTIAEAAVRFGFESIILADGDTVEIHNLNRQAYSQKDVGSFKVKALGSRLKEINPNAQITEHCDWITGTNVEGLVANCDLIFDTIDFLDLATITAVHDQAHRMQKPVISAVSAGWGAAVCFFPPSDSAVCGFRKVFSLPDQGPVDNASYVKHFGKFMERISSRLDPAIVQAMAKALTVMEDGTPCPAPHISVGSFAVASLAVTVAARLLNGDKVTSAPHLLLADMNSVCLEEGIDLLN